MDFLRKMSLLVSIVLYAMCGGTFINCLLKYRYYRLKNKGFLKEKGEDYILSENEEKYWKNRQERYIAVPATLFCAFFISALIFTFIIMIIK